MRKVVFYLGGMVADFVIPDDRFDEFSRLMPWDRRYADADLARARDALAGFVRRSREAPGAKAGPNEILAACFVWNYFNTHPEQGRRIDGDVLIANASGEGESVDYMPAADADLVREN
jgi:hypothetical protein